MKDAAFGIQIHTTKNPEAVEVAIRAHQAEWNALGALQRHLDSLALGMKLSKECLIFADADNAQDAANFREWLSKWRNAGRESFRGIGMVQNVRGDLVPELQRRQSELGAIVKDATDSARRGDWEAFRDAVKEYCDNAAIDYADGSLRLGEWAHDFGLKIERELEAADAAASGTAATAAADAPMVANPAPSASVGGSAAATGAAATATPSVTFEQEAQGVTKRVIVNGMTDAARAQAQAVQAFANWNAPQGGAQVAPQIATTRKRGYQGLGIPTDDAAKEVIKAAMIHKRDNPDMKNPDVIQWLLIKGSRNVKLRILQDRNHTAIDPDSELGKDLNSYYGYDRKKQTGETPLKMGGMVFDIGKICTKWGSFMSAVKRSKEKNALVQIGEYKPKLTYKPQKRISKHKQP